MGRCICTTMEEVRKCRADCDPTPRKRRIAIDNRKPMKKIRRKKEWEVHFSTDLNNTMGMTVKSVSYEGAKAIVLRRFPSAKFN